MRDDASIVFAVNPADTSFSWRLERVKRAGGESKHSFLRTAKWLHLFFATLNCEIKEREFAKEGTFQENKELIRK